MDATKAPKGAKVCEEWDLVYFIEQFEWVLSIYEAIHNEIVELVNLMVTH